jgi:plastocyanin
MENDALFYLFGGILAVLAVVVSFIGLRSKNFPPSGVVMGGVIAIFAVLVAGTAVFGVASARDEQAHREAEQAEHAAEEQHASGEAEPTSAPASAEGPGATLQLAADPEALAFVQTELSAKPGPVTIELDNPAQLQHNVAIQEGSEVLAESETISDGRTSVSAELAPGAYEFVCTVPGHEESGMKGTLTVE